MADDPEGTPPPRGGRRFIIPTPADLRHPRQGRAGRGPGPQAVREGTDLSEGKDAGQSGNVVAPDDERDGQAPPLTTPTPGTLPRRGRTAVRTADQVRAAALPPVQAAENTPEAASPTELTIGPGMTASQTQEPQARRIFPNPAGLMAAGRGVRKVRPPGFRGRRLPRVEETSAGGVVLDLISPSPRVALIARHDRRSRLLWSLPKGHVEEGESPEEAALREVQEETGLVGIILAPLGVIDFWFIVEDKRIHKTVHHFVIEAIGGELSDADVEVEAVEWVPFDQVSRRLAYGDERRLVEKVAAIIPGVR